MENLDELYDYFITNDYITTKNLKSLNINTYYINDLVKKDILKAVKRGVYTIGSVEGLYAYSKKLSNKLEIDKAVLGFLRCYEINPNHEDTCFWLLTKCIIEAKYDECFKYINTLLNTDDETYKKDILYIIYMLSFLTELPDKYVDIIKDLEFDDVKTKDSRVGDTHAVNCIRYNSMYYKSLKANDYLQRKKDNQGYIGMMDLIYKILIRKVRTQEIKNTELINEYIKKEDYESIVKLLSNKRKRRITGEINIIHYLCTILNDMIKTGNKPVTSKYNTPNCVEAIQNNNFELAEKLALDFCRKNLITNKGNLIYVLLCKINRLINKNEIQETELIDLDNSIKRKCEMLRKRHGVIILHSMKKEKRDRVSAKINTEDDIASFEIGVSEPKKLVLVYAPSKLKYVDVEKLLSEADIYYSKGDIKYAKRKLEQILETGKPVVKVIAKLGVCNLKLTHVKKALDYFEIATELSKELDEPYNFTELIAKIKNKEVTDEEDPKIFVKMSQNEFNVDMNSFYGITNIDDIVAYITTGKPVASIKEAFNLTLEQVDIVKLIFAREYYINGDFEYGDYYLKQVERSKEKSPLVKKIIKTLNDDKKFLMHRDLSNHKCLKLRLIKG